MPLLTAVLLGVLQGLTEFLPISSDGHLVVAGFLFGIALEGHDALGFDILLHGGSLLALLLVDRTTWWRLLTSFVRGDRASQRLLILLVLATIPAVIAGVFLEDTVATVLRSPTAAALGFLATAVILIAGERAGKHVRPAHDVTGPVRALLIGCAQAVAILPGVSRSGCTVSMGRFLGLPRRAALDFSFLLAVPILAGVFGKTLIDAWSGVIVFPAPAVSLAGFAASFAVSLFAITFLRAFVARASFALFAWYLIPLALWLLAEAWDIRSLSDIPHLLTYVNRYGTIAVFLGMIVESTPVVSLVSPGVFLLIVAGSLARSWTVALSFYIAAVAGIVLGNAVLYLLGYRYGRTLARSLHLKGEQVERAERFMARFGRLSVIAGQFVGVVRPVIGFVAGAVRMPLHRYFAAMIGSSAVWAALYLGMGMFLGDNVFWGLTLTGIVGYLLPLLGVGILGVKTVKKQRRLRRRTARRMSYSALPPDKNGM